MSLGDLHILDFPCDALLAIVHVFKSDFDGLACESVQAHGVQRKIGCPVACAFRGEVGQCELLPFTTFFAYIDSAETILLGGEMETECLLQRQRCAGDTSQTDFRWQPRSHCSHKNWQWHRAEYAYWHASLSTNRRFLRLP